jgi:hypothetical protein
MDFEGYVASQIYREEIKRADREASRVWRFRNHRTPEAKFLTAVVTSVLGLFIH